MKKIITILSLISILDAHSKIMLKRYHTYYKLGYEYSKSLLKDNISRDKVLNSTKEMCIDTVGSPYMDSKYKNSCIYGARDAVDNKKEIDLSTFLTTYIHEKF